MITYILSWLKYVLCRLGMPSINKFGKIYNYITNINCNNLEIKNIYIMPKLLK